MSDPPNDPTKGVSNRLMHIGSRLRLEFVRINDRYGHDIVLEE